MAQTGLARIAFIAVRAAAAPPADPSVAIVVGTNDADGRDWRYVSYPLRDLDKILQDGGNPFDEAESGEHARAARFHDGATPDDPAAPPPAGQAEQDKPNAGSIELDQLVLCTFYCAPTLNPTPESALQAFRDGPLARFETIGFAQRPDGSPAHGLVSRLQLQLASGEGRGRITGFTLTAQVQLALNGHRLRNEADRRKSDRFDTRLLMTFSATQPNVRRSLWKSAAGPRGAQFDELFLTLTLRPWDPDDQASSRVWMPYHNADLIDCATGDVAQASDRIDVVPAFAALKIRQPAGSVARRFFRFRLAQAEPAPPRVVLRFELEIESFADEAASLFAALVPSGALKNGKLPSTELIRFAQEQRIGDVELGSPLHPAATVTWIVTVRLDAAGDTDAISKAVLRAYGASVDGIHQGLRTVRDAGPVSALPVLTPERATVSVPWHAVGQLQEPAPWRRLVLPRTPFDAVPDTFRPVVYLATFEPRLVDDMWNAADVQEPLRIAARARFRRLVSVTGEPPVYGSVLRAPVRGVDKVVSAARCVGPPAWQPAITEGDLIAAQPRPSTRFALRLDGIDRTNTEIVLGAIGFVLGPRPTTTRVVENDYTGQIIIEPNAVGPSDPHRLPADVTAVIHLPAAGIVPAGQDEVPQAIREHLYGGPPRGDEAVEDGPLLIDLTPHAASDAVMQTLTAEERVARGVDQTLKLALRAAVIKSRQDETPSGGRLVLVIDPAPFRVAAVEFEDPYRTATSENNEVAIWSPGGENGVSWRLRDESETVRMLLPPQVIGEAMEKNASGSPETPNDVAPDRAAAARFAPLTRLETDPTFFDTRFREPGWNLRRNFGYPNRPSPGSRLLDLRFELLYGLTSRVNARDTDLPIWISEMAGVIGAPVSATTQILGEPSAVGRHRDWVARIIRAQRNRLAVDKLWSGRPRSELKLEDALAFRLRTRDPADERAGPETSLRWPVPGSVPADSEPLADPEILKATFSTVQDDRESFPGGVAWAFESANILMSVYGRPVADGGRLHGVHLSALGGYGTQRALFDERRTVVESETAQGRVQRYKLERIGRIGALWHRAKHVIVYERTVVPSPQFFNRTPIGLLQDEHAGRAILRKVEEYVEILQPVRRYPESGTAPAAAGFLVGAEFKSRKIRVDSRWGGDVRREGWQVPLWNKAFASLPAESANPDDPALIYPKPQIRFLLASEGGAEVATEVSEPEKLVFYTSVVRGESGDNTDQWRAVRDVDFIDMPPPRVGKVKPRSEQLSDAVLPPEPAHVPGYERLTIGMVRANEAVALAHARSDSGPTAVLKNITIARSAPLAAASAADDRAFAIGSWVSGAGSDVRAAVDAKVGEVLGRLERLDPSLPLDAAKRAAVAAIGAALDDGFIHDIRASAAELAKGFPQAPQTGRAALPNPCKALGDRVTEAVTGQVTRLRGSAAALLEQAAADVLRPVLAVGGLARDIRDKLGLPGGDPDEGLLAEERLALIDQLNALRERLLDALDEARSLIDDLRQRFEADVGTIADLAGASLGEAADAAGQQLAGAAAALTDLAAAIAAGAPDAITAEVERTIQTARAARSKLAEAQQRLGDEPQSSAARRALTAADAALSVALNLAERTRAALAAGTGLPDLAKPVSDAADALGKVAAGFPVRANATGSNAIEAIRNGINSLAGSGADIALALVDQVEAELDRDAAGTIFDLIDEAVVILSDPGDGLGDFDPDGALQDVLQRLSAVVSRIEQAAIPLVRDNLDKLRLEADRALGALQAEAQGLVANLESTCDVFEGFVGPLLTGAQNAADWLAGALDVEGYRDDLARALDTVITDAEGSIEDIKRRAAEAAAEVTREVEGRARQLAGSIQETLRDAVGSDPAELADRAGRAYQQGSETLRLLRAVGDPPKTDRLGFNRPEVAYVLSEANRIIDMTPAIGLVNRVSDTLAAAEQAGQAVGDLLQSFGVRLPTSSLGEQLIPEKLKGLSAADLIPDMAGIDFRGLLQRVAFPDLDDANAIRVRHGFDRAELRAWLEADLDVPFTESATLLSFGPVEIVIDEARFTAAARLSAGRDGSRRSMNGRIFGDWRVVSGGQDILTFRQTGLHFDDTGRIDFRLAPERVELAEALEFLTNLLAASGKGEGLVIEPLMRGPVPAGVAASVDLQLPDLQLGVFGISNLSMYVMFGIAAVPQFELLCDCSIARKTAPFTLSVWILNGGGFVTQRLSFLPMAKPRPILSYTLEVGIVAGVGLGFNFGVVSGGVWLQVGCSVAMNWTTGPGGNTTTVSVFILARGNVDVAGLVTASITLLLEVSYDGAAMIGSGTLRLSFKISMFYTLRVSQRVEYVFAGEKRKTGNYADAFA